MADKVSIATAVLARGGLVLLAHRRSSPGGAYADCWGLVGGYIEPGESPGQAIARECFEELSVHIQDPLEIPMLIADHSFDMHAFLVTRWTGEPANAAPEEHDDVGWFRPEDLGELTLAHPESRASILRAVQMASE